MAKRFVDIDLLKEEIKGARFIKNPQFLDAEEAFDIIDTQPIADVVEVKHGEWFETKEWYFDEYAQSEYQRKCYECSICKRTELDKEPYCHCGAKMDGGAE